MRKVLFVCQAYYPTVDATPSIIRKMVNYLSICGDTVVVVNFNSKANEESVMDVDDVKVHNINKEITTGNFYTNFYHSSFREKLSLCKLAINAIWLKLRKRREELRLNLSTFYVTRAVKERLHIEEFDAVVSVSYPFNMHWAVYKAIKNTNQKYVTYSLDPYSSNVYKQSVHKEAIALEKKILNRVQRAICLDLILADYQKTELAKYVAKVEVVNFPTIIKKIATPQNNDILFDSKYVNLTFVGYFYPDIRNPKFLLDLLCDRSMSNLRLNIIGGSYGDFPTGFWEYYKNKLGDRLIFHGIVDQTRAVNAMLKSDILINFGNTVANQMPSKVFEYMSTGKPILNIYTLDDCPTLKYFKRYPLSLSIKDDKSCSLTKDVERLSLFCNHNKGVILDFDQIEMEFAECTPDKVMSHFRSILLQ